MLIKCLPVGHLMTNCYIVTDETTLECAVIDPGDESNTILYYLEDNHLTCRAILLTHGHYDHTGAVYAVHEETGAPVYMNALDAGTAVAFDSYTFTPPEGTIFYKEGDEVKVNQPLMIVEAMKMETTFVSKVNGKVDKLYVAPGDRVNTEDLLVSFILDEEE